MKIKQKINIIFTKSELKKLILLLVGIVMMGLFEVVGISAIVPFIAVVVSPELVFENPYLLRVYNFFNFQNVTSYIFFLGVFLISSILVSNSYQAFMTWAITKFTNMQGHRLAVRLLENYLMQPYSFFLIRNTSDLGKNVLTEASRVTGGFVMQSLNVLSRLMVALYLFILLIYVNPIIALSAITFLGGIYALIFLYFKRRLHLKGLAVTQANYHRYKAANEAMSGIKHIKLNESEQEFVNRFFLPSKKIAKYDAQRTLIGALPRYLLEVVAFGGIVAIIISLISMNGGMDNSIFPMISLYVMAGYRLMPSFQQIFSGISDLKFYKPVFDKLVHELSNSNFDKRHQANQKTISFSDELQIKEVDFRYEGSKISVLNKINLTISHNTTVGIVGSTGSGKTTLIDIILGLLIPNSGVISLDGITIDSKNKSMWQKNIGYVPQSIYLTDDTIIANIAFAIPSGEISLERAKKAARMANLDKFVTTLPDQYETVVGERGIRLSGGQRQRIGIARALYHNPEVLILDEATSSLDGITEEVIIDAIKNLSHKKTIIMIAHRLTTVQECDIIHFMSNGKIVDSGSYEHLISTNDEFRRMAKHISS